MGAKLSKERYLVLFVDDSRQDCLMVRLAIGQTERLNFLGHTCDGDIVTAIQGSDDAAVKLPWADLVQMDFLMPRRSGVEVLAWLQSQPFKDLVVVVLPLATEPEELSTTFEYAPAEALTESDTAAGTAELLRFLQEYAATRGSGK